MTRFQYVAMLGVVVIATALCSWGQFAIAVSFGPPLLPVYAQPLCPAPGYIWTPGYWAWDPLDGAYYWVPGTWVLPPTVGLLWTPGYWGFVNGAYVWYDGYWGPTVGFYGGINYGFGYPGNGYYGGEWRGREFYYNRTVNNVNVTNITNVYNQTVPNDINRVAYNNGPKRSSGPAYTTADCGSAAASRSADCGADRAPASCAERSRSVCFGQWWKSSGRSNS